MLLLVGKNDEFLFDLDVGKGLLTMTWNQEKHKIDQFD